jgi:hypothetical protein
MGIPPILNVYRHDTDNRALVTLTGEFDLKRAPSAHPALERCRHYGIHASSALERLVAALTGSNSLFLAVPDAFTGILVHSHARLQERLLAEHQTSP